LLNTAVADAIGEITDSLREALKKNKSVDDAVLKVVREVFKETAAIRFEGNNYSEDWVKEAKKRGLPNLRRTPEALKEMISKQSRALLTKLGVLTKEELESRYHVRVERYVKDLLIELHTLREIVDTMVIPAAYAYLSQLSEAASQAKSAGIAVVPQVATANQVGELVQELQEHREDLSDIIARVEAKHDDPPGQAEMLTTEGADTMAEVRKICAIAGRCRSTGRCCSPFELQLKTAGGRLWATQLEATGKNAALFEHAASDRLAPGVPRVVFSYSF